MYPVKEFQEVNLQSVLHTAATCIRLHCNPYIQDLFHLVTVGNCSEPKPFVRILRSTSHSGNWIVQLLFVLANSNMLPFLHLAVHCNVLAFRF
jgi:hypothetical protein